MEELKLCESDYRFMNIIWENEPLSSGQLVALCIQKGTVLEELPLAVYKEYSDLFQEDLYGDIDLVTCVEKRISEGGTSVASVKAQIAYVREVMEND